MAEFSGIRLVVCDVDGTLVTHEKILTERSRAAVLRLKERDIRFAITSGRPPRGMAMLVQPLAIEEPIAGFNGGVYTTPSLTIMEQHLLAQDAALLALARLQEFALDAWAYSGKEWYVRDPNRPHVSREAKTVQFDPRIVESFRSLTGRIQKIVGVSDDFLLVRSADEDIRAQLGARASVSRSQAYYVDVTHPLANKGAVVDYHARRLELSHNAICAIGDGRNDVLMFAVSGRSIAMGNAAPEVQAKADVVTGSCDDEGFANAIERYLL